MTSGSPGRNRGGLAFNLTDRLRTALEAADSWVSITYIRCSTLLIELESCAILTDPWFSRSILGIRSKFPAALSLEELPKIDCIVVSHLHWDHFELAALRRLDHEKLVVFGPRGLSAALKGTLKAKVIELEEWERSIVKGISFTAAPAVHLGRQINFIIEDGELQIFFGGDTAYSYAVGQIAGRSALDIALLPISGTTSLGRQLVMDPAQALEAAERFGARFLIPIHEGNLWRGAPLLWVNPGRVSKLIELARARNSAVSIAHAALGDTLFFLKRDGKVRSVLP